MLEYLRRRACGALAAAGEALLATCGPAELQASRVACEARDLTLYLLVPRTSDHLFNLEHDRAVVIVTPQWELRGEGRVVSGLDRDGDLALARRAEAAWSEMVAVRVQRLHLNADGAKPAETIDLE
jgi:hypothetical protein